MSKYTPIIATALGTTIGISVMHMIARHPDNYEERGGDKAVLRMVYCAMGALGGLLGFAAADNILLLDSAVVSTTITYLYLFGIPIRIPKLRFE